MRRPNTTRSGSHFDDLRVEIVWEMARIIPNADPDVLREDRLGRRIERANYGRTVPTGWEIDHIMPLSAGGTDDIDNLQPLQWQNNRSKADSVPSIGHRIVAMGRRHEIERLAASVERTWLERKWQASNPGEKMPLEWYLGRVWERIQREIPGGL